MHGKRMHHKIKLSALELQAPKCSHSGKKNQIYQTDANTTIPMNIFVVY